MKKIHMLKEHVSVSSPLLSSPLLSSPLLSSPLLSSPLLSLCYRGHFLSQQHQQHFRHTANYSQHSSLSSTSITVDDLATSSLIRWILNHQHAAHYILIFLFLWRLILSSFPFEPSSLSSRPPITCFYLIKKKSLS